MGVHPRITEMHARITKQKFESVLLNLQIMVQTKWRSNTEVKGVNSVSVCVLWRQDNGCHLHKWLDWADMRKSIDRWEFYTIFSQSIFDCCVMCVCTHGRYNFLLFILYVDIFLSALSQNHIEWRGEKKCVYKNVFICLCFFLSAYVRFSIGQTQWIDSAESLFF